MSVCFVWLPRWLHSPGSPALWAPWFDVSLATPARSCSASRCPKTVWSGWRSPAAAAAWHAPSERDNRVECTRGAAAPAWPVGTSPGRADPCRLSWRDGECVRVPRPKNWTAFSCHRKKKVGSLFFSFFNDSLTPCCPCVRVCVGMFVCAPECYYALTLTGALPIRVLFFADQVQQFPPGLNVWHL